MKTLFGWLIALVLAVSSTVHAAEPEDVPLFSQAELDQMLAPVALYPDQLLSQILMAATYPLEVVQAARFQRDNPGLQGQDAVRAAEGRDWDPSVKSLLAFPNVLQQMDADLDWTERLGDAFLAQQQQVMDTVQGLRDRAYAAGNLRSNDKVRVVREREVIVVQPARPDVFYVPYYDPLTIYGSWWWPAYRPVYWDPWPGYGLTLGYSNRGGFYWGVGINLGASFFFGDWDWPTHRVRVVPRPPFYYHRPPPVHYVWVHDHHHRRGHPYRHRVVEHRYVPHDGRPVHRHDYGDRRDDRYRDGDRNRYQGVERYRRDDDGQNRGDDRERDRAWTGDRQRIRTDEGQRIRTDDGRRIRTDEGRRLPGGNDDAGRRGEARERVDRTRDNNDGADTVRMPQGDEARERRIETRDTREREPQANRERIMPRQQQADPPREQKQRPQQAEPGRERPAPRESRVERRQWQAQAERAASPVQRGEPRVVTREPTSREALRLRSGADTREATRARGTEPRPQRTEPRMAAPAPRSEWRAPEREARNESAGGTARQWRSEPRVAEREGRGESRNATREDRGDSRNAMRESRGESRTAERGERGRGFNPTP